MGRMHATVYGQLPNAQLVAVCDHREEKAKKFGDDFGAEWTTSFAEMVARDDIDAIDICLPTFLHAQTTIDAARAGKHILCEKPMALTTDEADQMIVECDQAGIKLMIGHCIRFWPEYAILKGLVESKQLGELRSATFLRYGEFPSWSSDNWLADESKSGGGVLDMHIHDTDFALYICGEPHSMFAAGTIDSHGPSHAFTTLQYPNCVIHLEGGWNLPNHTPFKMAFRAVFDRGAAIMDGGALTIYEQGKEPVIPEIPKMEAQGGGNISDLGGYYHEIKYFVDCLEQGKPFETVTAESSRSSLHLALREIEAIKSGGF